MKYIKSILLLNLVLLIFSCGTVKEGFSTQKKNSADEFLVEKKSPLVMPPDFDDLPKPDSDQEIINTADNPIEELLKKEKNLNSKSEQSQSKKDFEDLLLDKIKQN